MGALGGRLDEWELVDLMRDKSGAATVTTLTAVTVTGSSVGLRGLYFSARGCVSFAFWSVNKPRKDRDPTQHLQTQQSGSGFVLVGICRRM